MFPGRTGGGGLNWGSMLPGRTPPPKQPTTQQAYTASIPQTASDYDRLMKGYQGVAGMQAPPGLMQAYQSMSRGTPYAQNPDVTSSLSNLSELAKTGGYSQEGLADIRARGISPIRAVYANAMQNLNRQRALQGGYSPNYTAATTRMSRDLSEQLAGVSTNVNAQLAEMVARGRLGAAGEYAGAAGAEAGRGLEGMRIGQGREMAGLEGMRSLYGMDINKMLEAMQGQRSLYGTTPALAETFGRQALGGEELGLRRDELNQRGGLGMLDMLTRGYRGRG